MSESSGPFVVKFSDLIYALNHAASLYYSCYRKLQQLPTKVQSNDSGHTHIGSK
ncbi:hypothetical protein FG94_04849 [Massilia sp. LC238]|nr:hypothetical protein FG94_04849 [Massilia sp. LC238]